MRVLLQSACITGFLASALFAQNCDCAPTYAAGFSSVPLMPSGPIASVPMAASHCVAVPVQCSPVVVAPRYEERTVERTVMVPKLVDEKRKVREIEYRTVERERDVTVYEVRPRTRTVQEKHEVLEPVTRTRKEQYTVLKPVTEKVRREVTVSVPVEVQRTGYRTEYRPEYRNVVENYDVIVPKRVRRKATQTVSRMVPVQRTRTVRHNGGYWATQQVAVERPITAMVAATSVSAASGIGGCSPCVPVSCGCQTEYMARQVFVPQTVERQQPYTTWQPQLVEVPFEYDQVVYQRERRQRTVRHERLRAVKVPVEYTEVVYRDKKDFITERVERLVEEPRERTIRYTELVPRTKVENVRVTEYEEVPVKKRETYTALVPREVEREITVQVYKDTPTRVTERVRVPAGGSVIR